MSKKTAVISCSPSEKKRKEKKKKKKEKKKKRKEKEGEKRRKEKKKTRAQPAQRRAARLGGHVHPAVRGMGNFRPFLLFRDPPGPVWRALPHTTGSGRQWEPESESLLEVRTRYH